MAFSNYDATTRQEPTSPRNDGAGEGLGGANGAVASHGMSKEAAANGNATSKPSLAVPRARGSFESNSSYISGAAVQSVEHGVARLDSADMERPPLATPTLPQSWLQRTGPHFWLEYRGMVLMILAQLFGATMSTTARYLQTIDDDREPMSTFQIIFVRMSVTMVASLAYMWWARVPHAPFGVKEVRYLLLARGFGGFFGVFGFYYALVYLPLAEATVITFLAPLLAAWICSVLIKTPFTRVHKIAGAISLAGVVLIAQPFHFINADSSNETAPTPETLTLLLARALTNTTMSSDTTTMDSDAVTSAVTPAQHAIAVVASLVGVAGAACAYTTISWIGKRAHPLISMNYFATWCTFVSALALIFLPDATFRLPASSREWLLMLFLGTSGFVMQFLMTSALSHDRNRATALNMVYTQILFALTMDRVVWGTTPGWVSIVGSSLILGAVIWVALAKERVVRKPEEGMREERERRQRTDEETGLVEGMERGGTAERDDEDPFAVGEEADWDDEIELRKMDSS